MHYIDMMPNRTLKASDYLRGQEAFHLARCPLSQARPALTHDHDFYEIFWVEAGSAEHMVNGQTSRLASGTAVFIRPADTHALWRRRHPATVLNLMFRAETLDALRQRYHGQFAAPFFWTKTAQPETHQFDPAQQTDMFRDLARLFDGPRTLARLDGFLLRLMASESVKSDDTPDLPPWLRTALTQVDNPAHLRRGARGLSDAAGRSHEHVCRVVKDRLGKTASEVMNERRMAFAARALLTTDCPIAEIAELCGLENKSYFYRLFRAQHGMTPRAYRTRNTRDPVNPTR
ncbi:helix-turn-helix domain-containing protein [Litoreibacter roseus]|uniref:HTH araC/xylS-type domain-containing protein n=1 Tax=Litoreibacter roseus TaxID=2601869 RepID=A0A6N6JBL6_9RHOB|nr:AraC family transcriptional regulator [Litoreibacter roseus]GFE63387.1 hypothetical protein KIN_04610 [Litoreibacter roseus]